jgi:hypothetical protein
VLLLVDLDGVVYRGTQAVPGVAAVLADRAAGGDHVVDVTNSSIWHHADFVARLAGMGGSGFDRPHRFGSPRDGPLSGRPVAQARPYARHRCGRAPPGAA